MHLQTLESDPHYQKLKEVGEAVRNHYGRQILTEKAAKLKALKAEPGDAVCPKCKENRAVGYTMVKSGLRKGAQRYNNLCKVCYSKIQRIKVQVRHNRNRMLKEHYMNSLANDNLMFN